MTSLAAERYYEAKHLLDMEGRKLASYNPHNKPIEELPIIFGFRNGGSEGWMQALAISQDGKVLGGHVCSSEGYMPHDLGILEGTREDRHTNDYQKHYPGGYRMRFIPSSEIETTPELLAALELAKAKTNEQVSDSCP
jgi:hypothetical protein